MADPEATDPKTESEFYLFPLAEFAIELLLEIGLGLCGGEVKLFMVLERVLGVFGTVGALVGVVD